jgi:hypothetical protein
MFTCYYTSVKPNTPTSPAWSALFFAMREVSASWTLLDFPEDEDSPSTQIEGKTTNILQISYQPVSTVTFLNLLRYYTNCQMPSLYWAKTTASRASWPCKKLLRLRHLPRQMSQHSRSRRISGLAGSGGRRDVRDEAELHMGKLSWTSFYAACLENKDQVRRFDTRPIFRIVARIDRHGASKHIIRHLNHGCRWTRQEQPSSARAVLNMQAMSCSTCTSSTARPFPC